MSPSTHDLPPDLLAAARVVEEHAPSMTEPQLARVKRRIVGSPRRARSRAAIVALLATGGLMTTGGAAVGVSALSTELSAKAAQYGPQAQSAGTLGGSGVAGASATSNPTATPGGATEGSGGIAGAESSGVAGASQTAGDVAAATAQAPRQLEASGGSDLPFTGFAAIPMLLGGIALLAAGLVMRRRPPHARLQA
jgi:hypothetical protein